MEVSGCRDKLKELEQIITDFQDHLFRFAFFRTGSLEDSQDIVQEVFIKLYNENGHLTSVDNIKHYLFKSISNACTDFHRENKKRIFETFDKANLPEKHQENDASHEFQIMEEYHRIETLLSELPVAQSEVIRLKVMDNLNFVEIASLTDVPVTTVKSRFKYGIEKLKNKFKSSKEDSYGL